MKIIKTVSLSIELTRDDVEQAVVNFLPQRFAGKTFTVYLKEGGGAVLDLETSNE